MHGVAVSAHDAGFRADIVGNNQVAALARKLGPGVLDHRLGLCGKADNQRRATLAAPGDGGENVGVFNQRQGGRATRALLDLLLG